MVLSSHPSGGGGGGAGGKTIEMWWRCWRRRIKNIEEGKRKTLMKLPVCGPKSTDDSYFYELPSGSVNGSSSCKEQVSQANTVVERPISPSWDQERNHSADGSMET